jgi:hypothetical protein
VVASTVADVRYIAEHLNGTIRAPRAVITGMMNAEDRRSALAATGPGECVVATPVAASDERWPANTTLVLWPSPVNEGLLPSLALTGSGVGVVELTDTGRVDAVAVSAGRHASAREVSVPGSSSNRSAQSVAVLARTAKGRRLVGSERQALAREMVRRYTEGESIRALAEATGRSYGFVHRILTESGVQLRQRAGARRRKKA